ncbi:WD repeat-containing protein 86-like [Homarus americanus]|uniref:WD repeat-containing protein 86-like n=1 Tax=Homarus americanus TaxID=6706 RepID=UPI001C44E3B6|nr:WD repeat-containing protein 86-like [Homarus americanus]
MGSGITKELGKLPLETLCDHDGGINCIGASDDESLLVTGSEDKTARVWAIGGKETECIGIIKGHTSYITCVTVHDTFAITGSADNTLRKWDIIDCDCLYTYEGHESRITRVLCTGEYLVSTSQDHTARAWYFDEDDLEEHTSKSVCIKIFEGHTAGIYCQVIIPGVLDTEMGSGDVIITGSLDCTARSWSFTTGKCLKKFEGHTECVSCMATDVTGKVLYTGGADKTLRSWDVATAVCYRVFKGHLGQIVCMVVLKQLVYSGDGVGEVKCWDAGSPETVTIKTKATEVGPMTTFYGHKNTVNAIKFHRGLLYTASSDNYIRAFDAKTSEPRAIYEGHKIGVNCIIICASKLYSGSTDTTLIVWGLSKLGNENEEEASDDDDGDNDSSSSGDSSSSDDSSSSGKKGVKHIV